MMRQAAEYGYKTAVPARSGKEMASSSLTLFINPPPSTKLLLDAMSVIASSEATNEAVAAGTVRLK